jgi:pyrroloquinoline-quinone synthase
MTLDFLPKIPDSPSLGEQAPRRLDDRRAQVDHLVRFARAHRAVRHPFLITLATGGFGGRTRAVARRFAHAYHGFSSRFPEYLEAVLSRLERPSHRARLSENLAEERGRLDPEAAATLRDLGIAVEDVDGVPHPVLFERYCDAVGATTDLRAHPPVATRSWSNAFLLALRDHTAAFGVGALGIASESIVAPTYAQILAGLTGIADLDRRDLVFFELHCHVDDRHQEDLLQIARDLAEEPGGAEALERGARVSLSLRAAFWDALYASCLDRTQRAREPSPQELLHA